MSAALLATIFGIGACSQTDEPMDDESEDASADLEGPSHMVAGVGLVQYGARVRSVATVNLPAGGAVHFFESDESSSEQGHGCAGFFPADAPGEPALVYNAGTDGCLGTFLKMTSADTPVPEALLLGSEGNVETDRRIVRRIDEAIMAINLPLVAQPDPVAGGSLDDFAHSCTGDLGSSAHWTSVHCDEGGADHCDPLGQSYINITTGATYKGSYQTALVCGSDATYGVHQYYDGVNWYDTLQWTNATDTPNDHYVQWSTWVGTASWKRQIFTWRFSCGTWCDDFKSYTKMCTGAGDCPLNG